ncbi:MAG: hypothetical protein OXF11_01250 [Deltaproteobacteria bacterium]|nr:hypothetical protein [Deltaproteobacteria bacterium]
MSKHATIVGLLVSMLLVLSAASVIHGAEFYKGKTIRLVVGAPPGGGYDAYTRLTARHLGKYVPGNPATVVINRPGAGTLVTAHYVGAKSKPDGLTIGIWNSSMALREALGDRGVKLKHRDVGWIGAPGTETLTCAFMGFTGIRSFDDVLRSKKPIKMGATRAGSNTVDLPTIMNKFLGTRFNVISGYRGVAPIRLAMQSREVDGFCSGWEPIRGTARAMLDAKGDDKLVPVIIHRNWDEPEVKDLPTLAEVFKEKGGAQALAVYQAYLGPTQFMRPLAVPPGTPAERVAILRTAFAATVKDKQFLADAARSKLAINPVSGEQVDQHVENIFSMSAEARKGLGFLVRKKKK